MQDAKTALSSMEDNGDISFPATGKDLKTLAKGNWSDNKNVTTFFETLPDDKTYYTKEEVMEDGHQPAR